ncbi:MAG: nuclear transport factor 2 family protein, partial [Actinomycetota bacterium]
VSRKLDNARALYREGIQEGNAREAVTRYTGDRYTQHSTGVPDGIEGFVEFFEDFLARNPERDIRLVRGFEDGDHVFIHAHQVLAGGETQWVTMDFFDTDADDRIIEHWDVIVPYAASTPSGHTSVDGPTEVTDLHATDANKAVVRALIEDVLMRDGDPGRLADHVAESYIQHNAEVPDGRAAFEQLANAADRPLWYEEIVLLMGQGNFVATLCRATYEDTEYAQADLFRLENGKVVEHWDAAEPVPPPEELANSGKF